MNYRTADPDAVFRALKPAALDGLTKDAYANRRDADLGRALGMAVTEESPAAAAPARRSRLRRTPLIAGVATAAVIAAGGTVALAGHSSDHGHRQDTGYATAKGPLDARTVLLTAADTALKTPAATGNYWYTRVRTQQKVLELKGASKGHARMVAMPFTAYVSWTEDTWVGSSPHDHSRSVMGIDVANHFATPADEAKWKAMGSPNLTNGETPLTPLTTDYPFPGNFTVVGRSLSMKAMVGLPTTTESLQSELRRRYGLAWDDPKYPLGDSFALTVWSTATDLLSEPISSGTRAALFRILAEQPGIKVAGTVTDPQGRRGIAVDMPATPLSMSRGKGDSRLIIDPATTRLLAYLAWDSGDKAPVLTETYGQTEWVKGLGDRP